MALSLKHLVKERGEHVVGVSYLMIADLQAPMKCDCCGKPLDAGTRVLGKSVQLEKHCVATGRFSPTCLECADLN